MKIEAIIKQKRWEKEMGGNFERRKRREWDGEGGSMNGVPRLIYMQEIYHKTHNFKMRLKFWMLMSKRWLFFIFGLTNLNSCFNRRNIERKIYDKPRTAFT